MKRQIQTSAAAVMCVAVKKLDTSPVLVHAASQRSAGRFDGNTTATHAVSKNGADLKRVGTWLPDEQEISGA
jgi:hypothetical protein